MRVAAAILAGTLVLSAGPALAETQRQIQNSAAGRIEPQQPFRAQPVSLAQRQAVTRAAFETSVAPALKIEVQDDKAVEVEVPEKDAWFDTEGVRVSAKKVAYSRRF